MANKMNAFIRMNGKYFNVFLTFLMKFFLHNLIKDNVLNGFCDSSIIDTIK